MHVSTNRSAAMALAAIATLLAAVGCPLPQKPPPSVTVTGVYHVRLPAADASARVVTLWIQTDGTALLETVFVGKERLPVERGRWAVNADVLTVRLDDEPEPLVFTITPDRLEPRSWDRSRYGATGLTLTRRAAYNNERPSIWQANQPARVEP